MKKLILFLCLLMAIPAIATKKTFKAACLNVDGLPPTVNITGITKINMNPEGPQETGTAKMSELVANKGGISSLSQRRSITMTSLCPK